MRSALPRRRLIPRWRPVAATLYTPEVLPVQVVEPKTTPTPDRNDFLSAVAQWRTSKEPGLLGDVMSFSLHENLIPEVIDVGLEAIRTGAHITATQEALLADLRRGSSPGETFPSTSHIGDSKYPFQFAIRRLRQLLRAAPANPLALLDYAQLQAAVGKTESAERALRTAMALAPNNRLILRTIARFYVHTGRFDLAHKIIRSHQRTASDPWLMASEIALADVANAESAFLAKAKRRFAKGFDLAPVNLTELAGVVAMAELSAGNQRRAREAQRMALLAPNDNVIAHAVDFQDAFGVALQSPAITAALSTSHEAMLWQSWRAGELEKTETHSLAWHNEEPFSSRPILLLTTLYAYSDDLELARRWIDTGLLTDPHDKSLLINLAFVQAREGKPDLASATLKKLRHLHGVGAEPFIRATEGLIAYSQSRFADGDTHYEEAIKLFATVQPSATSFCRLNQAFWAFDFGHPSVDAIVKLAQFALEKHTSPDSIMLLKMRALKDVQADVKDDQRPRLLSQWVFDKTTNTLTERGGVTARGAPALVIAKDRG